MNSGSKKLSAVEWAIVRQRLSALCVVVSAALFITGISGVFNEDTSEGLAILSLLPLLAAFAFGWGQWGRTLSLLGVLLVLTWTVVFVCTALYSTSESPPKWLLTATNVGVPVWILIQLSWSIGAILRWAWINNGSGSHSRGAGAA